MRTRRSIIQTIAGGIVLGTMFLCALVARGATLVVNPEKEETPTSIGKTIGQVTIALMGAETGNKINIYFNKKAFPKGSVNTWSELGDRLITFVKNYKPAKLSTKYDKEVQTQAKNFKEYGIVAINTLHAIRNSNAYEALSKENVSQKNLTSLVQKLARLKKISTNVKKVLAKLATRIKKHENKNTYPAEPVSPGKKTRISLAHIEKKLRDAFTSVDVIIDRMLKDAEKKEFVKGFEESMGKKRKGQVPPGKDKGPAPAQPKR
ncbi:MAG: hypothetical protein M1549_04295 [Candidatus Dependentiae bacterium]|nr:hypothetical protein [Candidatus Dependentiae bacterium]